MALTKEGGRCAKIEEKPPVKNYAREEGGGKRAPPNKKNSISDWFPIIAKSIRDRLIPA